MKLSEIATMCGLAADAKEQDVLQALKSIAAAANEAKAAVTANEKLKADLDAANKQLAERDKALQQSQAACEQLKADKEKVETALANARQAILDEAIRSGRITAAEKDKTAEMLANEADGPAKVFALPAKVHVQQVANVAARQGRGNPDAVLQIQQMVNERARKDKITYHDAYCRLKAEGKIPGLK